MLAPYHAARSGVLSKHPVDYSNKEEALARSEMVEYSAEDRVKLSIHPDGFVQFSGENPSKIVSGRDSATGEPKGLGLMMAAPLEEPITTGPTFGVVVWGLRDFAPANAGDYSGGLRFSDADFYNHDSYLRPPMPAKSVENPYSANGYAVEAFVLPARLRSRITLRGPGGSVISIRHPGYQWRGGVIDLRVAPLADQTVFLGFMVSRIEVSWESASGFTLSSPSDLSHALMAMYPPPFVDDLTQLDLVD